MQAGCGVQHYMPHAMQAGCGVQHYMPHAMQAGCGVQHYMPLPPGLQAGSIIQ